MKNKFSHKSSDIVYFVRKKDEYVIVDWGIDGIDWTKNLFEATHFTELEQKMFELRGVDFDGEWIKYDKVIETKYIKLPLARNEIK